jgi:type IV pilus assembly protein PilV
MLCKQAGSVLLEAMISILIFSIGILAMVGMQATAINNVSDAKYRADAGFFADQIIGTMWAARAATVTASGTSYSPDPSFACANCTATSGGNAATQLWVGTKGVAGALPNPSASIAISGQQVTVTLTWQPPQAATAHKHSAVTFIN